MRPGLYAIVDPERCGGRDPIALAEAILAGGCAAIQLRAKQLADRDRLALARRIRALARARGIQFVINDRPDLAILAGADELHLGQDDLPIAEARRIVGAMPIGRSTHDLAQARAAVAEGADRIGFGPVFDTRSKERPDPTVGVALLSEIVRAVPIPVVAIGGITLERAPAVRASGVAHAAVIAAIGESDDPERAARDLHRALGGDAT